VWLRSPSAVSVAVVNGYRRKELDDWVRDWEYNVKHLLIPTDSQVGRYDDYVHFADYEGTLIARTEAEDLLAVAPPEDRAGFEARLRAADSTFVENTDPDMAHLLVRSDVLPVDDDEVSDQVWLTRLPKHGVYRRAIEREATRCDAKRAAGSHTDDER
jgi:hypothetical protein